MVLHGRVNPLKTFQPVLCLLPALGSVCAVAAGGGWHGQHCSQSLQSLHSHNTSVPLPHCSLQHRVVAMPLLNCTLCQRAFDNRIICWASFGLFCSTNSAASSILVICPTFQKANYCPIFNLHWVERVCAAALWSFHCRHFTFLCSINSLNQGSDNTCTRLEFHSRSLMFGNYYLHLVNLLISYASTQDTQGTAIAVRGNFSFGPDLMRSCSVTAFLSFLFQ